MRAADHRGPPPSGIRSPDFVLRHSHFDPSPGGMRPPTAHWGRASLLDEAGSAGIGLQLAPQPQNVHIDATVEDILVRAGRLQQVFACVWALRRVEESDQQGIFTFRQRNHRANGVGKPLNVPIEPPAAKLAAAVLWIPP
jgi:hypothetical protein